MNLALILKLLHIATAFWLITGIVRRNVVLSRAGRSSEIQTVRALLPMANIFERGMVLPGSSAVKLAGLLAAWAGAADPMAHCDCGGNWGCHSYSALVHLAWVEAAQSDSNPVTR